MIHKIVKRLANSLPWYGSLCQEMDCEGRRAFEFFPMQKRVVREEDLHSAGKSIELSPKVDATYGQSIERERPSRVVELICSNDQRREIRNSRPGKIYSTTDDS
jgi:hypothetical protein